MSYKQYKQEWLGHDITSLLIKTLKEDINTIKDQWALAHFTGKTFDETAQLNAKALGLVEAYETILEYITSTEETKNDET